MSVVPPDACDSRDGEVDVIAHANRMPGPTRSRSLFGAAGPGLDLHFVLGRRQRGDVDEGRRRLMAVEPGESDLAPALGIDVADQVPVPLDDVRDRHAGRIEVAPQVLERDLHLYDRVLGHTAV